MPFSDLLRGTTLLSAAVATALGAISVLVANRDADEVALTVAFAWWVVAAMAGAYLGRPSRAAQAVSRLLAGARTATSLPPESAGRIALGRLWPFAAFAFVAGGAGLVWPQVAAIGAGFAILTAMLGRTREAAVIAVEERDGVRFYVEPSPAFSPVRLLRTPGLYRDRPPTPKPPPPPPVESG
jgi:hypothetical protein